MKTLEQIKKEQKNKYTELFNKVGLFWAFSNEQFAEGARKNPLNENDKYLSVGAGGYIAKSKVDIFVNGMEDIKKWYKKETAENKAIRIKLISYELSNHECYYIGDIQPALDALGSEYTKKEVLKVYKANYQKWAECNA